MTEVHVDRDGITLGEQLTDDRINFTQAILILIKMKASLHSNHCCEAITGLLHHQLCILLVFDFLIQNIGGYLVTLWDRYESETGHIPITAWR